MKSSILICFLLVTISGYSKGYNKTPGIDERNKVITLFPNPSYNGNITISSNSGEAITFYLFDLDGKMIYQEVIKKDKKVLITGLKKGSYMYNALKKDEIVDGGTIIVSS